MVSYIWVSDKNEEKIKTFQYNKSIVLFSFVTRIKYDALFI